MKKEMDYIMEKNQKEIREKKNDYIMEDPREAKRLKDKVDTKKWVTHYALPYIMAGNKVLDVGCGPGVLLKEIVNSIPQVHATGIDISDARLKIARENIAGLSSVQLKKGSAIELPFKENSFDFVYSRFLLEYLREPQKAIHEMTRVLRPGGLLFLQDLDGQLLWNYPVNKMLQKNTERFFDYLAQTGFDPFIGRKLFSMVQQVGLKDIKVKAESYHLYPGEISNDQFQNWELKLDIALPLMEKAFNDQEKALQFKQQFLDYLKDEKTLTYSVLFSVLSKK